jgi:hypothetical protein
MAWQVRVASTGGCRSDSKARAGCGAGGVLDRAACNLVSSRSHSRRPTGGLH